MQVVEIGPQSLDSQTTACFGELALELCFECRVLNSDRKTYARIRSVHPDVYARLCVGVDSHSGFVIHYTGKL